MFWGLSCSWVCHGVCPTILKCLLHTGGLFKRKKYKLSIGSFFKKNDKSSEINKPYAGMWQPVCRTDATAACCAA